MDKQQLLHEIQQAAGAGALSREEVLSAFHSGKGETGQHSDLATKHVGLSDILYYIGGAIVFLGIVVLCFQNWQEFNTPVKILITLGSSAACYIVAALLHRYENLKNVSQTFFLLSAMLAPVGAYVTIDKLGWNLDSYSVQTAIFAALTAVFLGSFFYFRRTVLALFSIIFATAFFHFLVLVFTGNIYSPGSKIPEYRFLVTGLSYIFLGYYLSTTSQKSLTGPLYAFGSLIFLGTAMYLGGWQPDQSAFWELIYPLLVFGIIFASVYVKSKSFLVFGTLFLIGYILKLTSEYFSSGLGWPLALVLAGLAIMGVGYYAVRINKKYLTTIS